MIRRLERLHDIPSLALHDGHLASEHAFLEVGVLTEDQPQRDLGVGPPRRRRQERQEVVARPPRERLSDERDGKEEPSERETAPLWGTVSALYRAFRCLDRG